MRREGWQRFTVPRGSRYRAPGAIHVEGDASSASYFVAMGAIAATADAPIRIEGVGIDSIQGDIRFVDAARAMGAEVASGPGWLQVHRGRWPLSGITLDCNHIPDAAMTLAVMALYADTPTRLTGIASWRVKETDRIAAMATELRKVGAAVAEGDDFIEVTPPRALAAGSDPHLRRPPHGDVPGAGRVQSAGRRQGAAAHPRPALRRQDLPRLFRNALQRCRRRRPTTSR